MVMKEDGLLSACSGSSIVPLLLMVLKEGRLLCVSLV